MATTTRTQVLRTEAVPLGDHDAVLDLVGDRRVVLLGEATHGSTEFYAERRRITQRLIAEKGFRAVAVEADFPDARRASLWAEGRSSDATAADALRGFTRFPSWMWRNVEIVRLLEWRNSSTPSYTSTPRRHSPPSTRAPSGSTRNRRRPIRAASRIAGCPVLERRLSR